MLSGVAAPAIDPAPPVLTFEQQLEAHKLYAHLLVLRTSDVRQVLLTLDGNRIGIRPTGRRVDIATLTGPVATN